MHLGGAYVLVIRRLAGDGRQLTPTEDWPSCPAPTEDNWRNAVQELTRLDQELRRAVRAFAEERLDQPLVPEVPYSAYTQFIGIAQHNIYHAGQISVLKKALGVA